MGKFVFIISLVNTFLFVINVKSQSVCSNDTIERRWQNDKLILESHLCDSGYYAILKSEGKTIYYSGFGDGYLGETWWLKIPNNGLAIVMSAFYCDGNSYSILTVDSINNCKNHYLFDSYAGDECDTTRATELIIKDENRDGYEELYFYYKEEKTT